MRAQEKSQRGLGPLTKKWTVSMLTAMALVATVVGVKADDTELFMQPPGTTPPPPTVMFLLDNSSNWSRAAQQWPDASTAGLGETQAIVAALSGVSSPTSVGLAEFNTGPGAYVRFGARPMFDYSTSQSAAASDSNKNAFNNIVNGIGANVTNPSEKVNSATNIPEMGAALYEMHKYYNSMTPFKGAPGANPFGDFASNASAWTYTTVKQGLKSGWAHDSAGNYVTPAAATGCGKRYVIMIVNNAQGAYPTGSATYESTTVSSINVAGTNTFVPSWAGYLYRTDNVVTYVLDAYNAQQNTSYSTMLAATAKAGGGRYFAVKSTADVQAALQSIFNEIQSVNSVFASATLPVSANIRGTNLNQIYLGVFRPDANSLPNWPGNLKEYQLGVDPTGNLQLVDALGQPAISSTTGFAATGAMSFWTSQNSYWQFLPNPSSSNPSSDGPDGPLVERGGANQILRWAASSNTNNQAANRTVYTYMGGNPATPVDLTACASSACQFATANTSLTSTLFGTTSSQDLSDTINWIRGQDLYDDNMDGATTDIRPTAHGDVIHSRPAVLNYNRYGDDNDVAVFYGANDGLLHAVQGGTVTAPGNGRPLGGQEYWTFAAPEFFPAYKRQKDQNPQVIYGSGNVNVTAATALTGGSTIGVIGTGSSGIKSGSAVSGSTLVPAGGKVASLSAGNGVTLSSAATADAMNATFYAQASGVGSISAGNASIAMTSVPTGLAAGQSVWSSSQIAQSSGYKVLSVSSGSSGGISMGSNAISSSGAGGVSSKFNVTTNLSALLNTGTANAYIPSASNLGTATGNQLVAGQTVSVASQLAGFPAVGAGTTVGSFASTAEAVGVSGAVVSLAGGYAANALWEGPAQPLATFTIASGGAAINASGSSITLSAGGKYTLSAAAGVSSYPVGTRVTISGGTLGSNPAGGQYYISASNFASGSITLSAYNGSSPSTTTTYSQPIKSTATLSFYPRLMANTAGASGSSLGSTKLVIDGISMYGASPIGATAPVSASSMGGYLWVATTQPGNLGLPAATTQPSWVTGASVNLSGTVSTIGKMTLSQPPTVSGYASLAFSTTQNVVYTAGLSAISVTGAGANTALISKGMTLSGASGYMADGTAVTGASAVTSGTITIADASGNLWTPSGASAVETFTFGIPFKGVLIAGSTSAGVSTGDPTSVPAGWTLSGSGLATGTTFVSTGTGAKTFVGLTAAATGSGTPSLTYTYQANGLPKPYFFDGAIGVWRHDANADGKIVAGSCSTTNPTDCDAAYIFAPMRRGGRMIYAFDVTDPKTPKLMWKHGCSASSGSGSCDAGWGELGETWSMPQPVTLANGTLALIFGGGYDATFDDNDPISATASRSMGRAVFVVNAKTGDIIRVFSGVAGSASANATPSATTSDTPAMSCSIPSDVAVLTRDPLTGITLPAFRAYVGDTCGQMFRLDISDKDPSKWFATQLFTGGAAYYASNPVPTTDPISKVPGGISPETQAMQNRKFLFSPDVAYGFSDANGSYHAVLIGSGDREHPFNAYGDAAHPYSNGVINRLYMLKDYNVGVAYAWGGVNPLTAPNGGLPYVESRLYDATLDLLQVGTATQQNAANIAMVSGTSTQVRQGWRITLDVGEKSVGSPTSAAGYAYFGTNTPTPNASAMCTTNLGEARMYQVGITNAQADPKNWSTVTSPTQRYTTIPGGGLPPTPVPVAVMIKGQYYEGVVTGTQVQTPTASDYGSRIRMYYKKMVDR